jgi:hypothetical protein
MSTHSPTNKLQMWVEVSPKYTTVLDPSFLQKMAEEGLMLEKGENL